MSFMPHSGSGPGSSLDDLGVHRADVDKRRPRRVGLAHVHLRLEGQRLVRRASTAASSRSRSAASSGRVRSSSNASASDGVGRLVA